MRQTADERFRNRARAVHREPGTRTSRAPDGKKGMNLSDVELLVGIAVERALQVGRTSTCSTRRPWDVISVVLHEHPTE